LTTTSKPHEKAIERLNSQHFFLFNKGRALVGTETPCKDNVQSEISFSTFNNLQQWCANVEVFDPTKGKKRNIADIWLASNERRQYNGVIFDPSYIGNPFCTKEKMQPYNLYQGFAVRPKEGDCSMLKNHIFEILCSCDQALFTWVMDWIASIVQRPQGPKPGVAIVIKGKKGTGKGTAITPLLKIFGTHALHLHGLEPLVQNFNSCVANKILVFVDESVGTRDKKAESKLKSFITEKTVLLEQKYVDAIEVDNHMNFIFASNERFSIPASMDERRFLVLTVSPDKAGDYNYFERLHAEIENGGTEAFLHELLNRRITSNLRDAPKTSALWQEILESLPPEELFIYEILQRGKLIHAGECNEIPKSVLFHYYNEHIKNQKIRKPMTAMSFSQKVREIFPAVRDRRTMKDGKRFRVWDFPPLERARSMFEAFAGWPGQIEWGDIQ
jgi:hypothetical protein